MTEMISFDAGDMRFNYRVAAIIMDEGRVLVGRCDWEDFWYVPGGRVEAGERATDALLRELREELGIQAEAGRLLWVIENFFRFDGRPFHEIGLYFLVEASNLPQDLRHEEFTRAEPSGETLIFRWIAAGDLDGLRLGPGCLAALLQDLPAQPQHVVNIETEGFERA